VSEPGTDTAGTSESRGGLLDSARTVLLVHAHPDDETLATGALILELVARGIRVTLVTATRGERGEVVPALRDVIGADERALARRREQELRCAGKRLGVSQAYLLGRAPARASRRPERRYEDSGMRWIRPGLAGPAPDVSPQALSAAPLEEVVDDLRSLIVTVEPELVISYDDNGGYGHPDHVRVRDAARRGAAGAGVAFAELVSEPKPDAEWLELGRHLPTLQEALRCHASQLTVDGEHVIHSGGQREPIVTSVALRLVTG
jgi:N-acetyl-1-D-myo-inositol-2-amino-2-deoxy-alpha-D-glucopyranoside deacetylase